MIKNIIKLLDLTDLATIKNTKKEKKIKNIVKNISYRNLDININNFKYLSEFLYIQAKIDSLYIRIKEIKNMYNIKYTYKEVIENNIKDLHDLEVEYHYIHARISGYKGQQDKLNEWFVKNI